MLCWQTYTQLLLFRSFFGLHRHTEGSRLGPLYIPRISNRASVSAYRSDLRLHTRQLVRHCNCVHVPCHCTLRTVGDLNIPSHPWGPVYGVCLLWRRQLVLKNSPVLFFTTIIYTHYCIVCIFVVYVLMNIIVFAAPKIAKCTVNNAIVYIYKHISN